MKIKGEIDDIYGLTPMQENMLLASLETSSTDPYYIQSKFLSRKSIDIEIVKKTLFEIVNRHDSLRTVFVFKNVPSAKQVVLKERDIPFHFNDISAFDKNTQNEVIGKFEKRDRKRGFDLSKDVPLRVAVFKLEENLYHYLWSYHHIILDAWSINILVDEFIDIYTATEGNNIALPPASNLYKKYIALLSKMNESESREYWNNYLKKYDVINYFTGVERGERGKASEKIQFALDESQTTRLNKISTEYNVTLGTLVQCLWAVLLSRFNDVNDTVFGCVVSGRNFFDVDFTKTVGLFINTVPRRITLDYKEEFEQLCKRVHNENLHGDSHHSLPLTEILKAVGKGKNIFDHILVFQNAPASSYGSFDFELVSPDQLSVYNFTLTIFADKCLKFDFAFDKNAIKSERIEYLADSFKNLFEEVIQTKNIKIRELEAFSQNEKIKLLGNSEGPSKDIPRSSVSDLIYDSFRHNASEVAIVYKDRKLTYNELEHEVDQLASFLIQEFKVQKGQTVATLLPRSIEFIVAALAIMRCGGVLVPIDPNYPSRRVDHILSLSRSKLAVSSKSMKKTTFSGITQCLIEDVKPIANVEINPGLVHDDPVYVIFTSGSTGNPKGVEVRNKSFVNYLTWANTYYFENRRGNNFAFFTSLSFDLTMTSIFTTLLRGDEIVIFDEQEDISEIVRQVFESKSDIDAVKMTPSHVNILGYLSLKSTTVSTAIIGGEELKMEQINILKELNPNMNIYNEYGPTEATIGCSVAKIENYGDAISIGKPIDNTCLYILDVNGNLQPKGARGELHIGGACLSNGYLNDEVSTRDKFVSIKIDGQNRLLYKSGDMAYWNNQDELILLGRIDEQIKINGYRVELSEIEHHLNKMVSVDQGIVKVINKNGQPQLCAFYTSPKSALDELRIKSYLKRRLPDYMLPIHYKLLAKFPLTTNGKIDRDELQLDDVGKHEIILPTTEMEQRIFDIWTNVLQKQEVAINADSDFFTLDSNSLTVIKLLIKLNDAVNENIKISDLYEHNTIQKQAIYFEQLNGKGNSTFVKSEKKEFYDQSHAQKRLFILNQLNKNDLSYNVSASFEILGNLDNERIESAFNTLLNRHEVFRSSFLNINETLVQKVHDEGLLRIEYFDSKKTPLTTIKKEFFRPFDLSNPPLMRVAIVKNNPQQNTMILDMHHIICDGVSIDVFVQDFLCAYSNEEQPKLEFQYKEYAEWQNYITQSQSYQNSGKYWKELFKGYVPLDSLPIDAKRPLVKTNNGRLKTYNISKQKLDQFRNIAKELDVSLFTLLLTCVSVFIGKLSNLEEVVLATSVSGRNRSELNDMIGMFVNTLAIRTFPENKKKFSELVMETKSQMVLSMEHQDYSFENIISNLELEFDTSRTPLFDIMFVLQEEWEKNFELPGVVLKPVKIDKKVAKFDLTIECIPREDRLEFNLEYNTDIFKETTIDRYFGYLENVLDAISENPNKRCSDVQLLSKKDQHKILFEFNDTKKPYSDDITLNNLFEKRAVLCPDAVAIITSEQEIGYRELDQITNQVSHALLEVQLPKGELVGILMNRSIDMVIAVMAVLKAGGVYVPLDPNHPDKRIAKMCRSLKLQYFITETNKFKQIETLVDLECDIKNILCLGEQMKEDNTVPILEKKWGIKILQNEYINQLPTTNANVSASSEDYAYIIHTSGSTGLPKGVLVKHKPAINLIEWVNKTFDIDSSHKLLFVASLGFDLSVYDIFGILAAGGTIRLANEKEIQDAECLLNILFEENITFWDSAPAAIQQLLPYLGSERFKEKRGVLQRVFLSGDWVPLTIKENLQTNFKNVKVTALGGATEATIWSNFFEVDKIDPNWLSIPYGKPIQNAKYYVLDSYLNCCPIGTPGDLYIGGNCLAQGYMNEIKLTNSKFLPNPFCENERIYRTGDRARWFDNGNLEFLGRLDSQIKLRGYRIELGEIETQLKKHDKIGEVVVDIRKTNNSGDRKICAYYTSDHEIVGNELYQYLDKELPFYMIPSYFTKITEIPVTGNGKMNRKALPEPKIELSGESLEPATPTEFLITDICSQILKVDSKKITLDVNFAQLGGNSIDALNLVSEIERKMSIRISLMNVFRIPTLRELCKEIEGYETSIKSDTPKAQTGDIVV
ncbi:amino acid adenylation domain-containing protein [Dokdonia sp.]|uniref:amino acid adenylation domain-containing protein n=1 Tax=Dokdonia sp. TaxID=2024995 RepID=UPI003267BFF3